MIIVPAPSRILRSSRCGAFLLEGPVETEWPAKKAKEPEAGKDRGQERKTRTESGIDRPDPDGDMVTCKPLY